MAIQIQTTDGTQVPMDTPDVLTIVRRLTSRLYEGCMREVVDIVKDLDLKDSQLIVDLLATVLEKEPHTLKNADRVLRLLTSTASSTGVIAYNRILDAQHFASNNETFPNVYIIQGDQTNMFKKVMRGREISSAPHDRTLLKWVHLSHSNILPAYGAFLEGDNGPLSLVSPYTTNENIVKHAEKLPQVLRMPFISDLLKGLCYLHQLNIVHGELNPETVLISDDGYALITKSDTECSTARYSAPELLEEDNALPTRASDMWSFACLCYEVCSGNIPFCQLRNEGKVALAVVTGKKPVRPGHQGVGGSEIGDTIWHPISACWEPEPEGRPDCMEVLVALSDTGIRDDRPAMKPLVGPKMLEHANTPLTNVEHVKSIVTRVLGSDRILPSPSSAIPEQLRNLLFELVEDQDSASAVAAAVKKFQPSDIQIIVDVFDMAWEDSSSLPVANGPFDVLLTKIMTSTRVLPQRYKIRRIQYDGPPIGEGTFGYVCEGRELGVNVNVVNNPDKITGLVDFLALWAHSSHPNVVPFYGAFHEDADEVPRFCFPSLSNVRGILYDYAPQLPQLSRLPLILDVIHGLTYLHELNYVHNNIRGDTVLITEEGRGVISAFDVTDILTTTTNAGAIRSSGSYMLRFRSPEQVNSDPTQASRKSDIWSFGALCYAVLSRKVPYHQCVQKAEFNTAISRGQPPRRPGTTDNDIDPIDDQFWDLILACCRPKPEDRPTASEIEDFLAKIKIRDDRPKLQSRSLPGPDILSLRMSPDVDWERAKQLLGQIQVELLQNSLLDVIGNRTKDVATVVVKLQRNDTQTLVDFMDMALKEHLTGPDERNRILGLLSRVMTITRIFPRRHELNGIKYEPKPIASGGFGSVHRGQSDPTLCVKVTTRVDDPRHLVTYIKELILWAHSTHPNILPFYGVFFDDLQRICLVSPYMSKGNLSDYARQLSQNLRVPLLLDTIKGLDYLHGLGIVHTDLKGENVLISEEGRGLLTDFGASHVITTAGVTSTPVVYTLRFTAPEVLQSGTQQVRPRKECDIWSFGCLCYQVLSRKLPYYEYQLDGQVFSAILQGRLPRRPGVTEKVVDDDDNDDGNENWDDSDDDDWGDIVEKDWDELDDTVWMLIMTCLVVKPEDRPSASRIEELIAGIAEEEDPRPARNESAGILEQKSYTKVDLKQARALLDHLQVLLLTRSFYKYSDEAVVAAANKGEAEVLINFWSMALKNHLSITSDRTRVLALLSTLIGSQQRFPAGYNLQSLPRYDPKVLGEGSFGKVYRGSVLNVCIKATQFGQMDPQLQAQWDRALAPWANLSHPNILPFYGAFLQGGDYLVSPFIENGNLHSYAPHLPQKERVLIISDVIEGLMYLHKHGIIHGNLKTQNVLVSSEGRGLIADFRPYNVCVAAAADGPTGSFITSTLRFTAPELVKNSHMLPTSASDVWSIGCLFYEVLSQKTPYYQYTQDLEIRSALSREELLTRPTSVDHHTEEIEGKTWDLVTRTCSPKPGSRPKLADLQNRLRKIGPNDDRPATQPFHGSEILKLRQEYVSVGVRHVAEVLDRLKTKLDEASREESKIDSKDSMFD